MSQKSHRPLTNSISFKEYSPDDRHRSVDSSNAPPKSKGGVEIFVILGLIVLQLMAAVVIMVILRPFSDPAEKQEDAFNAPLRTTVQWVTPQPTVSVNERLPEPPPAETATEVTTVRETTAVQNVSSPMPVSTINIRGLEITQGIQVFNEPENPACHNDPNHPHYLFCNNAVPLIAGRHTLLRLYLACGQVCPTTDVNVRIKLLKDGREETVLTQHLSEAWLPAVHSLPLSDLRLNLDQSVNFKLFPPPAWLSGPITFEVEVIPDGAVEAPVTLALTRTFAVRKPLRIAYLPIQHQGATPPDLPGADHWLLRLYPVPAVDYYRLPVPDLVWDREMSKAELLNELLYTYLLYTQHNPSETWPDQLFGWLPQDSYNGGAADPTWCPNCAGPHSGRIAFGGLRPEQDIGGPRILVHEIAHNLGAQHAWSPTEAQDSGCFRAEGADIQVDPSWPYAQTPYIQEVGVDVYSDPPLVYPPSHYDMMSYCTHPWISPHTYRKIFDSPLLQPQALASRQTAEFKPRRNGERPLLMSGIIYPDGRLSRPDVTPLDDAQSAAAVPLTRPAGEDYCVAVYTAEADPVAERCFDAGFGNVETGLPTSASPYAVILPDIDVAAVTKITLSHQQTELVSLTPSATPPQITLTSPQGGDALSDTVTLTWTGSDADGDSLTYNVLYSVDDGQSWLPLATRLQETTYTFDTAGLLTGPQILIRIVANDGFHTGMAETETPLIVGH